MTGGGGVYGAVGDGIFHTTAYLQKQVSDMVGDTAIPANGNGPGDFTEAQLDERINRLDTAHRNIQFAQGIVEWILRNTTQLQP